MAELQDLLNIGPEETPLDPMSVQQLISWKKGYPESGGPFAFLNENDDPIFAFVEGDGLYAAPDDGSLGVLNRVLVDNVHSFPGMIVETDVNPSTLESNWATCDGTLGTPDLRDKFTITNGPSHPSGTSGGAATVDVSHSHLPGTYAGPSHGHSHSHTPNTFAGPNHSHSHNHTPNTFANPNHSHGAGALAGPSHGHGAGGTLTFSGTGSNTGDQIGAASSGTTGAANPVTYDSHHHGYTPAGTIGGSTGNSGTGSVTGSTATDGGASITGVSSTDATTGGTGAITGVSSTDATTGGTGAVTGTSGTSGSASLAVLPPFYSLYRVKRVA